MQENFLRYVFYITSPCVSQVNIIIIIIMKMYIVQKYRYTEKMKNKNISIRYTTTHHCTPCL